MNSECDVLVNALWQGTACEKSCIPIPMHQCKTMPVFRLWGSRLGLVVRFQADEQKDPGSIRFESPFSSKLVVYGHCLVTLLTQFMRQ